MTDECLRLRVYQYAKLRGVSVDTVWIWIEKGRVVAEKDEGGHRWWVIMKKNNRKEPETTGGNRKEPICDQETA
jgi:hypothetical protein